LETVQKTLDILESFLDQSGEIGVAELSKMSGVNITTTHRIVSDLVKRGYLRQKEKRGKYSIGTKLLEFNPVIQSSLKIGDLALPFLQKISQISGEYSEVAVLESCTAMTVAQVDIGHNLRISNTVGERLPLHATSFGKLFLAHMKSEEMKICLHQQRLKAFTKNTLTDLRRLEHEINLIRQQGFSLDNEEYGLGMWSVAAPIFNFDKSIIAGLCIAAPLARLDNESQKKYTDLVKDNALEISKELRYRSD
jgi:IclR family transcriptional regulator, KDG regulon repressor